MSRADLTLIAFAMSVLTVALAGVRHGWRSAVLVALAASTLVGALGLSFPFLPRGARMLLGILLVTLVALPICVTRERARRLSGLLDYRGLQALVIVSLSVIIPFGGMEMIARALTERGVLPYYVPLRSVYADLGAPGEDWRRFHITVDRYREPDPVLFWRSVASRPYTAQRFKGPLAAVPKRADVFRIMAYGDSNTDGPDEGGWPAELHRLFESRRTRSSRQVEVLNAGVAGYSSLQGLRRFRQEVAQYRPDLVLVSFGWNDPPAALGKADKEFEIGALSHVQRLLFNYRFYLVLKHALTLTPPPESSPASQPRVSLADYAANLEAFSEEGARHGATVVLLTRPYRASLRDLAADPTWRRHVPAYNERLRQVAEETRTLLVDVQRSFDGHRSLFMDECHFTPEGHRVMAELLYRELGSRLSRTAE